MAKVASFNAKRCIFAHDDCRNTGELTHECEIAKNVLHAKFSIFVDDHPLSGQNLAIVGQSKGYKPFREAYEDLHDKWFMEHEYCGMKNIKKYQNKPTEAG